jgi:hypothetical protein
MQWPGPRAPRGPAITDQSEAPCAVLGRHGPAKSSDIERVRQQCASAQDRAAHRATRHWQRVMDRAVQHVADLPKP